MRGAVDALAARPAEDAHAARRRTLETEHEAKQRRLAAAVRAGDRDELAGVDAQGDILEHTNAGPVAERDALELDDGRHVLTSERLLERREVRAHDGEVVLPGGDLVVGQALERVEHRRLDAGLARDRLRELRRDERLEEHGRRSRRLHEVDEVGDAASRRLGLGREPLERHLLEAVPRREVAERGVARDDLASLAARKPATELGVEPLELAGERVGRLRLPELDSDRTHHRGVANRVEPHVRVANDLAVLILPLLQILSGEKVERAAARAAPRRSRARA